MADETPAGPLVDLAAARLQLRLLHDDDDALVQLQIEGVSDQVRGAYAFPAPTPANVKLAVLLMIDDVYHGRPDGERANTDAAHCLMRRWRIVEV